MSDFSPESIAAYPIPPLSEGLVAGMIANRERAAFDAGRASVPAPTEWGVAESLDSIDSDSRTLPTENERGLL
jgi:hypothetical protein